MSSNDRNGTAAVAEEHEGLAVSQRMTFHGEVPDAAKIPEIPSLGESCELVSDHRGELSKGKAYEILELPEFIVHGAAVDRSLRSRHVSFLLFQARAKLFHPEWVTIITCVCDEPVHVNDELTHPAGTEFRMNGQHTCWMRAEMEEDWPCQVRFMKYRAKTVADMRRLYATIDRGMVRNNNDVIGSYLAGTEQMQGVPGGIVKAVPKGLMHWLHAEYAGKHTPDEAAYLVQTEYCDITNKVIAYLAASPRSRNHGNFMLRTGVVAAMFETLSKLPTKAHDFWDSVRDGIGFTAVTDPRKKLYDALTASTVILGRNHRGQSRVRSTDKRQTSTEEIYRWCIVAWNAWRAGGEIKVLRAGTGKRPRAK